MPNIATVFKQEISRLSRKEIRQQLQGLRKAATQYRRDIARLKRESSKLRSELARLGRYVGNGASRHLANGDGDGVRFTAKGVRSHRARLGISAADFGKLAGVTGHTVYKWEHEAAKPRKEQLVALSGLRSVGKKEAAARLAQLGAKPRGAKRARRK